MSNLGLRIDVTRTEDELGAVATSLNRAFDRLQEAFERQTRFTADASHELRTPLTLLMAELEWAVARPRANGEYRQSLVTCLTAAQRMRALVEGLLTLARADVGAIEPPREPVDVKSLVEEVVAGVESHRHRTRHHPARRWGGLDRLWRSASFATADFEPLSQRGSVSPSSPGGIVTCSITTTGAMTRVEVSDTGPGVEAEDLPHIFERFYRASKSRSRAVGGAGLGLAISKSIAESHGGHLHCESIYGHGARFTIELPAHGR